VPCGGKHINRNAVSASKIQRNSVSSPKIADGSVFSNGPGVYCFGELGFTPTTALVTLDNSDSLPAVPAVTGGTTNFTTSVALFKGPDLGRCNAAHGQIRVAITRVNDSAVPELVDHGFTIWIYG
jgi:hypothetical protein